MSPNDDGIPLRVHGGVSRDDLASLDIDPGDVVDFSASINPYGPCSAVVDAVRSCPIDRYPDPTARDLRRALADAHDIDPERIVIGNGAADLLWTLARVLVGPGDTAVIAEPTFAEFRHAAASAGAHVVECRASSTASFAVDLLRVEEIARSSGASAVYIASPNTPVGTRIAVERIAGMADRLMNVTIVLDQAFVTLSDHPEDEKIPVPHNVVRVRSLTKDHAIAGLRLGYLVARPDLARRLEANRPAWTTSAVAQSAGLAAVDALGFVKACRAKLLADRNELASALGAIGIEPLPSAACFVTFAVAEGDTLRDRLLRRRILVRDCSSFGMPGYVRVAARPRVDRERLVSALREELLRC